MPKKSFRRKRSKNKSKSKSKVRRKRQVRKYSRRRYTPGRKVVPGNYFHIYNVCALEPPESCRQAMKKIKDLKRFKEFSKLRSSPNWTE